MLLIYSKKITPRLKYICEELFTQMHGIDIKLTDKRYDLTSDFTNESSPKINYSDEEIEGALQIIPCGLLEENDIKAQQINVKEWGQYPIFFAYTHNEKQYFDLFSASFYLLSRYEEYLPHTADKHGRFKAEDSIAYQNGFLERPLVDEWTKDLIEKLKQQWPDFEGNKRKFSYLRTIDVDNVYAYRHKGPVINGIKLCKELIKREWENASLRLKVCLHLKEDPYFNLKEVMSLHLQNVKDTIMFVHCGCYGQFDKKTWYPSISYKNIKRDIAKIIGIGLHPSYRSASSPTILHIEKRVLEKDTNQRITHCRSHYLKYTVTEGYKQLEKEGFTDEYSMGYSNNYGFRASTSIPYHWYDLKEERASEMLIHPLIVMDKTLHSNCQLNTEEARKVILDLAKKVKKVNGEMVTLFHNENLVEESIFGWTGWKDMYIKVMKEIDAL